jgi:hypothetical protein
MVNSGHQAWVGQIVSCLGRYETYVRMVGVGQSGKSASHRQ